MSSFWAECEESRPSDARVSTSATCPSLQPLIEHRIASCYQDGGIHRGVVILDVRCKLGKFRGILQPHGRLNCLKYLRRPSATQAPTSNPRPTKIPHNTVYGHTKSALFAIMLWAPGTPHQPLGEASPSRRNRISGARKHGIKYSAIGDTENLSGSTCRQIVKNASHQQDCATTPQPGRPSKDVHFELLLSNLRLLLHRLLQVLSLTLKEDSLSIPS